MYQEPNESIDKQVIRALSSELISAITSGDIAEVENALTRGADPNTRDLFITKPRLIDRYIGGEEAPGDTALIIAVKQKRRDAVGLLISYGADVNGVGLCGETPLLAAIYIEGTDIFETLLKSCADTEAEMDYGGTALTFAVNLNRRDVVELLLQYGANVDGGSNSTPLITAVQGGSVDMVELLLRNGADVNLKRGPYNALERALLENRYNVANVLREADATGRTVEDILESCGLGSLGLYDSASCLTPSAVVSRRIVTQEDMNIIDVVISDLLDYEGNDRPFPAGPEPRLILLDESFKHEIDDDDRLNGYLDARQAIDITLDMRQDLVDRNAVPVFLRDFKCARREVIMRNGDGIKRAVHPFLWFTPKARGWARICLPGYTKSRERAVLQVAGGRYSGFHGVYYLDRVETGWHVRWRTFTHLCVDFRV